MQAVNDGDSCSLLGHKMASDGRGMRHLKAPFIAAAESIKVRTLALCWGWLHNSGGEPLLGHKMASSGGSMRHLNALVRAVAESKRVLTVPGVCLAAVTCSIYILQQDTSADWLGSHARPVHAWHHILDETPICTFTYRHWAARRTPRGRALGFSVSTIAQSTNSKHSPRADIFRLSPDTCRHSQQALGSPEDASQVGSYANLFMNGGEVFKFAVRAVPTVSVEP